MSDDEREPSIGYDKAVEMGHRTLNSRLDGYRQAGGSILTALVAFTAVFDATLYNADLDKIPKPLTYAMGGLSVGICVLAATALFMAGSHFKEMSAVIVDLDRRIGFFATHPKNPAPIYPAKWNAPWRDFSLTSYFVMAIIILFVQVGVICIYFGWLNGLIARAGIGFD